MPERSRTSATSWAWMWSSVKLTMPALCSGAGPRIRTPSTAFQDLVGPLVTSRRSCAADGLHADAVEIIDGRAQADGGTIGRRAGLELGRQVARLEAVQQHAADHAPAAQERRHRLQQLPLAVEHADARGPQHLVPAEGQEIAVQGLHVGLLVRHALGPVDQHHGPGLVGAADDLGHRVDRAQHVGDAVTATSFVRSAQQRVERVELQQAVVGQRDVPQHGPACARPSCYQGTRFEWCSISVEQDFVARLDVGVAPAPRHQVDARGRAGGEDALLALGGVDERADLSRASSNSSSTPRPAGGCRDGRWRSAPRSTRRSPGSPAAAAAWWRRCRNRPAARPSRTSRPRMGKSRR